MERNRLTITTESRILGDEYVRFGGEYIETCFHKGKQGALCLAIGEEHEKLHEQCVGRQCRIAHSRTEGREAARDPNQAECAEENVAVDGEKTLQCAALPQRFQGMA